MEASANLTTAFLGLGAMGAPMARRVAAHFPLTVWNRTRSRAEALSGQAARIASSPYDAAREASVVVTCVASAMALACTSPKDKEIHCPSKHQVG